MWVTNIVFYTWYHVIIIIHHFLSKCQSSFEETKLQAFCGKIRNQYLKISLSQVFASCFFTVSIANIWSVVIVSLLFFFIFNYFLFIIFVLAWWQCLLVPFNSLSVFCLCFISLVLLLSLHSLAYLAFAVVLSITFL